LKSLKKKTHRKQRISLKILKWNINLTNNSGKNMSGEF